MGTFSELSINIEESISKDKALKNAYSVFNRKLKAGSATYKDVESIAELIADALSKSSIKALDGISNEDLGLFAVEYLKPVYKKCQNSVLKIADKAQTSINKANNIGVKSAGVVGDVSRIDNICKRFDEAKAVEDVKFLAGKSVTRNIMRSAVTDTIKANAEALERAGAHTILTRYSDGGCCAWCDSVSGSFERGEESDDFWRVHNDCNCTIEYKCTFTGTHSKISFSTHENKRGIKYISKNTEYL